jgi:hypothetical protein
VPGVIEIGLAIADLGIARMWPCSALVNPSEWCGATPASKYLRACGVESHDSVIWLCPIHAMLVVCGGAICKECAARGGIAVVAKIIRLSEPVRVE